MSPFQRVMHVSGDSGTAIAKIGLSVLRLVLTGNNRSTLSRLSRESATLSELYQI